MLAMLGALRKRRRTRWTFVSLYTGPRRVRRGPRLRHCNYHTPIFASGVEPLARVTLCLTGKQTSDCLLGAA